MNRLLSTKELLFFPLFIRISNKGKFAAQLRGCGRKSSRIFFLLYKINFCIEDEAVIMKWFVNSVNNPKLNITCVLQGLQLLKLWKDGIHPFLLLRGPLEQFCNNNKRIYYYYKRDIYGYLPIKGLWGY
jgi:hypothetical protein